MACLGRLPLRRVLSHIERPPCGRTVLLPLAMLWGLCGVMAIPARGSRAATTITAVRQGQSGRVVYQPSDPSQFAGYPRVIRLAHGGRANGTLLVTFDIYTGLADNLLVYQSADNGRSWSHLATIADPSYAGRMCCATIFELPRALVHQPAGTLLLAESAGAAGRVGHEIKVFQSRNHGRTWTYLSSCARGAGGLWEPDFAIDRAGRLVCYFSDERRAEYSQFLGHVVSADGGRTWSAEHIDVAIPDGIARPGMATVLRLPGGSSIMSFEICGRANCEVHLKTSLDGDQWGQPDDVGSRVQTVDGRYAGHTPYIAWAPGGGPRGALLLTSQDLFGPDDLVASDSRRVLLLNRRGGLGPWTLIPAPIEIPQGGPDCANYSSALLPSTTGNTLVMVAGVALSGGGCAIRYAVAPMPVTVPPGTQ